MEPQAPSDAVAAASPRPATLLSFLGRVGPALLDLVYPPRCAACGEPASGAPAQPFCEVCAEAVDPVPPGCARCGLPGPDALCGGCHAHPPAFEAVHSAALFGGPVADAIHALKYQDRPALARPLGQWLRARVAAPGGALVVPVPLGRGRRRERGYDQAAELARAFATCSGLRVDTLALRRVRETAPQVGRSREARGRNVLGAFEADPRRVTGRQVVVLDDVVTTGATVDACARALRQAGARSVRAVSLARAE